VGITDIPKATDFYTKIMGMVVEKDGAVRDVGKPDERTETILYAAEAKRGARLVLIKYKDGRNTEKITAKLVWNTPNGTATVATAAAAGYATIYSMGINAQIYGPETYVHEFTTGMDSGGTGITVPYLIAVGFAVSDMNASIQFYGDAFGMTSSPTGSWPVTDANGSATITENTVKLTTGAGLVLQTWVSTPPRNTKDNPVKVIIFVPDAKSYADKVVAAGGKIVEPAKREATYDNRTVVEAKDLDGYWLEIVQ
jgi:predicted enzyme related to lactoylglutathione lyase